MLKATRTIWVILVIVFLLSSNIVPAAAEETSLLKIMKDHKLPIGLVFIQDRCMGIFRGRGKIGFIDAPINRCARWIWVHVGRHGICQLGRHSKQFWG